MPRLKQPATNMAQEALSLTSIANEGPMFFVPQGPLTEGAVLSAIPRHGCSWREKSRGRSLYDKSALGRR